MKCNRTCQGFCSWIEALPYHVRYPLPKESVPMLPECFRETLLGEMVSGAGKQFRGPYGVHVHELPDRWVLHRDPIDAGQDLIGHLIHDAPEYPASLLLEVIAALATGRLIVGRGSRNKALIAAAAGLASTFALAAGKMMKLLDGDPGDGQSAGPNQVSADKGR